MTQTTLDGLIRSSPGHIYCTSLCQKGKALYVLYMYTICINAPLTKLDSFQSLRITTLPVLPSPPTCKYTCTQLHLPAYYYIHVQTPKLTVIISIVPVSSPGDLSSGESPSCHHSPSTHPSWNIMPSRLQV